jgi:hypothetical protein
MRRLKRTWGFERLESRSLLTGVVTITGDFWSPYAPITIRGDGADNQIVVHEVFSSTGTLFTPPVPILKIEGTNTRILDRTVGIPRQATFSTSFALVLPHPIIFDMGGGNDTLRIHDTHLFDTLAINMGAGNDTLGMTNVIIGPFLPLGIGQTLPTGPSLVATLGAGNDLAILNNVVTAGDHTIDAGLGFDIVKLKAVSAGTLQSGNTLQVAMGPGKNDRLQVIDSSADHAVFDDSDTGGTLLNLGKHIFSSGRIVPIHALPNHFTDETESGFHEQG